MSQFGVTKSIPWSSIEECSNFKKKVVYIKSKLKLTDKIATASMAEGGNRKFKNFVKIQLSNETQKLNTITPAY
jgi:hypothetical protein